MVLVEEVNLHGVGAFSGHSAAQNIVQQLKLFLVDSMLNYQVKFS